MVALFFRQKVKSLIAPPRIIVENSSVKRVD